MYLVLELLSFSSSFRRQCYWGLVCPWLVGACLLVGESCQDEEKEVFESSFTQKLHYFRKWHWTKQMKYGNDRIKSPSLTSQVDVSLYFTFYDRWWMEGERKTSRGCLNDLWGRVDIYVYVSLINAHNHMDAGVCWAHSVWYDRGSPQLPDTNDIFTLLRVCVCVCVWWFYGKPGPHESRGGYPCSKLKLTFPTSTRPSWRMDSGRRAHPRAWYRAHCKLPDPVQRVSNTHRQSQFSTRH